MIENHSYLSSFGLFFELIISMSTDEKRLFESKRFIATKCSISVSKIRDEDSVVKFLLLYSGSGLVLSHQYINEIRLRHGNLLVFSKYSLKIQLA